MILYFLMMIIGIFLLLNFGIKKNKFFFAVVVSLTLAGFILVVATLILVFAVSNK